MDRYNILGFPLNPTLTIVRLIFRRVIQCESKGVQSAVQRCRGYTVLYLQTCKDLCIVQGTGAGDGQPAPQSKPRELRQRARATCFVPVMAINKLDFMAGISFFHMSARFRADFLATNKNSQDWEQPVMQKLKQPVFYVTAVYKKRGSFIWNFLVWNGVRAH